MKKKFLGFGLGAIQSGLMLLESFKSGNFEKFVIVEINNELVKAVRNGRNTVTVNIATGNAIVKFTIPDIEIYNPLNSEDIPAINNAIKEADELATAIPSVNFYDVGENSIAKLLAKNIDGKKPQILYASENNNYAAEILFKNILQYTDKSHLNNFQILNTVIGKMSGIIQDKKIIKELALSPITTGSSSAFLVEEFNHIIISKIKLPEFRKGIEVFVEKENLLPFEEAKLFGHNAVHSMLGYLAHLKGYKYMSEIKRDRELWEYGERAFRKESGAFLLRKYKTLNEELFTEKGFTFYGDDLLKRMTNPFLRDEVNRICRDPLRKLGYDDRLIGTIREGLKQGVTATTLAKGVIGGICFIVNNKIKTNATKSLPALENIKQLDEKSIKSILFQIWKDAEDDGMKNRVLDIVLSQFEEVKEKFIKLTE